MTSLTLRSNFYKNSSQLLGSRVVLTTLSDKRRFVCNEELGIAYFEAEVLTQTDYYPFGAVMPDRQWSAGAEGYRYGFNGKERDDDISNVYDYGFRIYNSSLGRFLSIDLLFRTYPYYTPYQFAGNNVIKYIDLDGLEVLDPQDPDKQVDGGVPAGDNSQKTQSIPQEVSVEEGFKTDFVNDVETPVKYQLENNPTRVPVRNVLITPLGSELTGDKGQYQGMTAKVSGVRIVPGGERLLSIYKEGGVVNANPDMPNESSELVISSDPFIPKSGAETGVYNIQVFTIEPPKYSIEIVNGIEVEKMVKEGQYLFFNYQITVIPLL